MDISLSPLYKNIQDVIKSGPTNTNFGWSLEVHVINDNNNINVLKTLKMTGLTVRRDYVNNYADEITCEAIIPLGKYIFHVYPGRNNLEARLTKTFPGEGTNSNNSKMHVSDLFKLILLEDKSGPAVGAAIEGISEATLDLQDLVHAKFQLIPKTVDLVRVLQVGGNFSNSNLETLMKNTITTSCKDVKVESKQAVQSVNILTPDNKDIKSQVVIPHGTMLVDLPTYLQKRIGVYSSGLGSYLQGRNWYIYYLYDTSRFATRSDLVTFIVVPPKKFPHIERTYNDNNGLTILITGDTHFLDDNNTKTINKGSGVRFTDANKLDSNTVKVKDNKAIISRGDLNNEYDTNTSTAPDKITNAPVNDSKITSNPYNAFTEVMARKGGAYKAIWHNADLSMLKPGMPARIMFDVSGVIKTLTGILHKATYMSQPLGGITGTRFSNDAELEFYVHNSPPPKPAA